MTEGQLLEVSRKAISKIIADLDRITNLLYSVANKMPFQIGEEEQREIRNTFSAILSTLEEITIQPTEET